MRVDRRDDATRACNAAQQQMQHGTSDQDNRYLSTKPSLI